MSDQRDKDNEYTYYFPNCLIPPCIPPSPCTNWSITCIIIDSFGFYINLYIIIYNLCQLFKWNCTECSSSPLSAVSFLWLQLPIVNHSSNILNGNIFLENSRNKPCINFKLCAILIINRDEISHCHTLCSLGSQPSISRTSIGQNQQKQTILIFIYQKVRSSLMLCYKAYIIHLTLSHHADILSSHSITRRGVQYNKVFQEKGHTHIVFIAVCYN